VQPPCQPLVARLTGLAARRLAANRHPSRAFAADCGECRETRRHTLCTALDMKHALLATLAAALPVNADIVEHRTVEVDGVTVFYREAGPRDAPTVLLLHGFPSSSFMYRDLIPALADRWHVVAPDYPGFGQSAFPRAGEFAYTFERYARLMEAFVREQRIDRFVLYVQDYGAPIGLRLALMKPERLAGLIVQNGNAYEEGLSNAWDPLKAYWRDPSGSNREKLRGWLNADGVRLQYVAGVPKELLPRFSPDTWTLDWSLLARPGNIDVQLDLFGDYRTNVELYPQFQAMLRERRPPTLVVWGEYDPFFTPAGARAFKRDVPDAEVHLLPTGHFALETHGAEIAARIRAFLARKELEP
jgi:pimeloyl-ACP methyl ester carboxylesterase